MFIKILHIVYGVAGLILLAISPLVATIPEKPQHSPTLHEHCAAAMFVAGILCVLIFTLTKYLSDDKA